MANFTLTRPDVFPEGTSVKALKRSNWLQHQLPPTADQGAADSAVAVSNGSAAFTGLADGTAYFATATVNSVYRVIRFATPAAVPATAYTGAQDFSAATLTLPSGLVIPRTAVLPADVGPITANTNLGNITGLGLSIGASATEIWLVKYWLLVNAANITMDAKFGFTVPAGCTMKWGAANNGSLAGWGMPITTATPVVLLTESGVLSVGTVAGLSGVNIAAIVFGGGSAGTVQIRFAQNTSDAGNLSIAAGSAMEAVKVAG